MFSFPTKVFVVLVIMGVIVSTMESEAASTPEVPPSSSVNTLQARPVPPPSRQGRRFNNIRAGQGGAGGVGGGPGLPGAPGKRR